jgi:hypothetical protein
MNRISARSINRPLDCAGIACQWDYPPALGRKSWPQRQKWFSEYMKALYRGKPTGRSAPHSKAQVPAVNLENSPLSQNRESIV